MKLVPVTYKAFIYSVSAVRDLDKHHYCHSHLTVTDIDNNKVTIAAIKMHELSFEPTRLKKHIY